MRGKGIFSVLLVVALASEAYGKLGSGVFYNYVDRQGVNNFYGDIADLPEQIDTNTDGQYAAVADTLDPSQVGGGGGAPTYNPSQYANTYGLSTFSAELQYQAKMRDNVVNLKDLPQIDGTLCQGTDTMVFHTNSPLDISAWGPGTGILGPAKFSCTPTNGRMTQFAIKILTISAITDGSFTVTYETAIVDDFFEVLGGEAQPNYGETQDPSAPAPAVTGAQNVVNIDPTATQYAQVFNKRGKWTWNPLPKEVYNIGETITASWNPGSNKKIKLRLLKRIIRPIIFGRGYSKELQKWKLGKGVREQAFQITEHHASSFYVYFQIQKGCIPLIGICDQTNSPQFTILGKGFRIGWNYDPNTQQRAQSLNLFHIGCKNGHRNTTGNAGPAGPTTPPTPDIPTNPTGSPTGEVPSDPPTEDPTPTGTGVTPPPSTTPPDAPPNNTPPPAPLPDPPVDPTPGAEGDGGEGDGKRGMSELEIHQQRELERRGFCEHGSYSVDLNCENCYVQGNGNYYKLSIGLKGVSVYAVGEFVVTAHLSLLASLEWGISGHKSLMPDIPLIATPRFSILGFHFGFGIYCTAKMGWSLSLRATAHAEAGIRGAAKFELTLDTKKPINPNFTKNFEITKPTYDASARVELRGNLQVGPSVKLEVANANVFEASLMLYAESVNWIEFQLHGFPGREDAPHPKALIKIAGDCPSPHYIEFDMNFELKVVLHLGGKWLKTSDRELFKVEFSIASGCFLKARARSTQNNPEGTLQSIYSPSVSIFLDTTAEAQGLSEADLGNALREEIFSWLGGTSDNQLLGMIGNINFTMASYSAPGSNQTSPDTLGGDQKLRAEVTFIDSESYADFDRNLNQLKMFSFNPANIPSRDGYNLAPKVLANKEYETVTLGLALDSASSVTLSFVLLAVAAILAL